MTLTLPTRHQGRNGTASYLAGALHTPHIGALPPDVAVFAVIVAILLL